MIEQTVTWHTVKHGDGSHNQMRVNGKVVLEDYYRAGGHTYEIPQGRGKKRSRVCFEETPRSDGEVLWEENGGIAELERVRLSYA